jgi:hypothetical protein
MITRKAAGFPMLSISRIIFFFSTDNQQEFCPIGFLPPFSSASIFFSSILKKVNDQPERGIRVSGLEPSK